MPETRRARVIRSTRSTVAVVVAVTIVSLSPLPAAAQPASTTKAPVGRMLIDGNAGASIGVREVRYDRSMSSSAAPFVAAEMDTTVVLVVRHAERVSDAANSDLSAAGLARAEHIAALAEEAGVQAVYSTDLCRTAQTAQPAAAALGLPIRVVATGSANAGLDACSPGIDVPRDEVEEPKPEGIARRVLREQPGRTVLVVGHSNTVPAIAEALGATVCPTLLRPDQQSRCWLADDRYDDLFIVRVPADGGRVEVELGAIGVLDRP